MTAGLLAMAASHAGAQSQFVPVRGTERLSPTTPPSRPVLPKPADRLPPARFEDHTPAARPEIHATTAKADPRIWSALILATNGAANGEAKPPAPEIAGLSRNIEKYFGYKQLDMIGSASKTIDDPVEHWLVPSQEYWLNVKSTREANGMYLLKIQIFHDERGVVETRIRVGPNNPVLIGGPQCARGQLVIAIEVLP